MGSTLQDWAVDRPSFAEHSRHFAEVCGSIFGNSVAKRQTARKRVWLALAICTADNQLVRIGGPSPFLGGIKSFPHLT